MPRNSGDNDLYLPLFAGTELARRSGNLTRFPPGNILGNLPAHGLRVRRLAVEQSGLPPCQLGVGNLITFLFYSDFGALTRPEASNWFWSNASNADWAGHPVYPSGPANSGQIAPFDVSAGTPGNNIHLRQTGVFGDLNYGWLQGAPVQAGFCKALLSKFAVRMFENNGSSNGTHVDQRWLFAPGAIHDENLASLAGLDVDQGNTAFGVVLTRSFRNLVIEDTALGFGTTITNAFSGVNGDSIYIEVYQTIRPDGTGNIRVDIGGVTRYNHDYTVNYYPRPDGGWAVLYPYLEFADSASNGLGSSSGFATELYTNTWSLDVLP